MLLQLFLVEWFIALFSLVSRERFLMGRIQITFSLYLKASLGAHPFTMKMKFHSCKLNSFSYEWLCTAGLALIERFKATRKSAIESRKTKTKVITLANHKGRRQLNKSFKTFKSRRKYKCTAARGSSRLFPERGVFAFRVAFFQEIPTNQLLTAATKYCEYAIINMRSVFCIWRFLIC